MSDLDLAEAIEAGYAAAPDAVGSEVRAAIRAAAPIIARQVAERIGERIEQQARLTDDRRGDYLPDAHMDGFVRGLRSAAKIAREVAR